MKLYAAFQSHRKRVSRTEFIVLPQRQRIHFRPFSTNLILKSMCTNAQYKPSALCAHCQTISNRDAGGTGDTNNNEFNHTQCSR